MRSLNLQASRWMRSIVKSGLAWACSAAWCMDILLTNSRTADLEKQLQDIKQRRRH
jgi:hypothetical protein